MEPINNYLFLKIKLCGVDSSLRAVGDLGFKTARLITNTDPMRQLSVIAAHHARAADCNIAGVHIFIFGGFIDSAKWMNKTCREYRQEDA